MSEIILDVLDIRRPNIFGHLPKPRQRKRFASMSVTCPRDMGPKNFGIPKSSGLLADGLTDALSEQVRHMSKGPRIRVFEAGPTRYYEQYRMSMI